MKKKYFISSDIHSFYDEWMIALEIAGFDINNQNHIIIVCGDLFDRGSQSLKCLHFITSLIKKNRAICIKGNHEDLLEDCFRKDFFDKYDCANGTIGTFEQLTTLSDISDKEIIEDVKNNELLQLYLKSCIDYYELGNNIFVHGWIPCIIQTQMYQNHYFKYPKRKNYIHSFDCEQKKWFDARWINGMEAWSQGIKLKGKTIFCGHWHTSWGHAYLHNDGKEFLEKIETFYEDPTTGKRMPYVRFDPFIDKGIVALDACTVVSHKINCVTIEI